MYVRRVPRGLEEAAIDTGDVMQRILAAHDAGDLITMCAWCKRITIDGREWVRPPRAALTAIDARLTLSHSICPSCAEPKAASAATPSATPP